MRNLALACAAIALAAGGGMANAQGKGNGNGNGNANGGDAAASAGQNSGGGKDRQDRGKGARKAERPDRAPQQARSNSGNGSDRQPDARGNGGRATGPAVQADRGSDRPDRAERADRAQRPVERAAPSGNGNGNGNAGPAIAGPRQDPSRDVRIDRRADRRDDRGGRSSGDGILRDIGRVFGISDARSTGLIDGCPPGLAKKYNGCTPPGQAKKRAQQYRSSLFGLSGLGSDRYFYDDGYLVRYGDRGIESFLPLLGGALAIGNIWPDSYRTRSVDPYYRDYYALGDNSRYRYADNVLYRVDPQTAAITSIAGLLTGDRFTIGERAPRGYDVYNVPYAYRDRYVDSPRAQYRYSDGYIYEIDPETRLVQAAIELLT